VGLQEEGWIALLLGQAQQLLGQLPRRLVLRPDQIMPLQPPQHREELWRLTHLLAELARPSIGLRHLGRPITPGDDERQPQGGLDGQLLPRALWALWEGLEQP
jgi:hypothetical protein